MVIISGVPIFRIFTVLFIFLLHAETTVGQTMASCQDCPPDYASCPDCQQEAQSYRQSMQEVIHLAK